MSGRAFVDTNILVYAHDISTGAKHEQARSLVADYLRWEVVVDTGESILDAVQLEERYQVSFWDALVIRAARECGADTLYSEDLNDGQLYDSVRVVNPFRAAAQ